MGIPGGGRRGLWVAVLACALLFGSVAEASATIRYAAPGGTAAAANCIIPTADATSATPCSIYEAAKGSGVVVTDEVVVAPGSYSDTAGDLGSAPGSVQAPHANNIHGADGKPRPVIALNNSGPQGFDVIGRLAHLEIDTSARSTPIYIIGPGNVGERLIVRSSLASGTACYIVSGTLRDSACLATGSGARGVGADASGTNAPNVRNVTAVSSSGTGATAGLSFSCSSGTTAVSVKSTIARAPSGTDVKAAESGCSESITIDHSNYATVDNQGGAAPVTDNGGQQTGLPALAVDGYHQLPSSSSTINLGATDASSGSKDIDGQVRAPFGMPDIGADELGNPTQVTLDCSPSSFVLGSTSTICHALVTDTAPVGLTVGPAGTVSFSSGAAGAFSAPSCTLTGVGIGGSQGECTVGYTPSAAGDHLLSGAYSPASNDGFHEPSTGSTTLTVTSPPVPIISPGTASGSPTQTARRCKKHKKHAASAARKCRRKR